MKRFYNLIPAASPLEESRLYIDGEIAPGESGVGWFGDTYTGDATFRQELSQCGPVTVYINSPGGDVFAGAAMYSALLEHPHRVTVKIMGLAASAASVVAMAGDQVLISPAGYMMIHDPWAYVAGNAREMEKEAQILREIGDGIAQAYQRKTGRPLEEIRQLLAEETYMNAQSAIEMGFADGLWDEDRKAFSEAASPAAMMRGRDYTPQAYMARARLDAMQNEPPEPDPRIAQALALVQSSLSNLARKC